MVLLPVVALIGAGCGGINASQSVSPASFLMPGIIKNCPGCTNNVPLVMIDNFSQIASVR